MTDARVGGGESAPLVQVLDEARLSPEGLAVACWRYRITIAVCVLVCAILGAVLSFVMQPRYHAEVVMIPAPGDDLRQALGGGLPGQLGGLASLAGINIGGDGNKDEYLEFLRSRGFIRRFIADENLLPVLFADDYDSATGRWRVDDPEDVPTLADGVKYFRDRVLAVDEERRTGVVTLGVTWTDRHLAAAWANQLVTRVNRELQLRAIREAQASLNYLNTELARATVLEVRQSIYRAIESQIKTAALANVREQYAFRIIDTAAAPDADDPVSPKLVVLVLLGAVLGALLGALIVFGRVVAERRTPAA